MQSAITFADHQQSVQPGAHRRPSPQRPSSLLCLSHRRQEARAHTFNEQVEEREAALAVVDLDRNDVFARMQELGRDRHGGDRAVDPTALERIVDAARLILPGSPVPEEVAVDVDPDPVVA